MEDLKKGLVAAVTQNVYGPLTRRVRCFRKWKLTCGHEEDSGAEDDVVARLVELTGGYTQTPHEEQDDAEDGKDAGGPNRTWETSGGRRRGDSGEGGGTGGGRRQRERNTLESSSASAASV